MTSPFDRMTVAQLKEEQKKRGILDSDLLRSGKNGSIIRLDRIVALNNHEEKIPKPSPVKSEGSGRGKTGLGLGSTHKAKAVKPKKSPPKKTGKKKGAPKPKKTTAPTKPKKATTPTEPKKATTPTKSTIFVLTYQIRGDYSNQGPTGMLSAATFEKLKDVVKNYVIAHREDEDHIEDEDFNTDAVEYTLNELKDAYKENKDAKGIAPELNCLYVGQLFKNVPYQP